MSIVSLEARHRQRPPLGLSMVHRSVSLASLPAALTGLVAVLAVLPLLSIALGGPLHSVVLGGAEVVLTALVSATIGLATRSLVASSRTQTGEARRHGEMLEQVAGVVRDLFASAEPRGDICRVALEISDATVTILFEPDLATGGLRCTAAAGLEPTRASPAPRTTASRSRSRCSTSTTSSASTTRSATRRATGC